MFGWFHFGCQKATSGETEKCRPQCSIYPAVSAHPPGGQPQSFLICTLAWHFTGMNRSPSLCEFLPRPSQSGERKGRAHANWCRPCKKQWVILAYSLVGGPGSSLETLAEFRFPRNLFQSLWIFPGQKSLSWVSHCFFAGVVVSGWNPSLKPSPEPWELFIMFHVAHVSVLLVSKSRKHCRQDALKRILLWIVSLQVGFARKANHSTSWSLFSFHNCRLL